MLLTRYTNPSLAPLYAYYARNLTGPSPSCSLGYCVLSLLAFSPAGSIEDLEAIPTAQHFHLPDMNWNGSDTMGVFRTSWTDPDAGWVGFRGGNGFANHNDLDGGSFTYDVGGVHWAIDLGADNYGLPNYFSKTNTQRFGYYRKSTRGHNTLTLDGDDAAVSDSNQDLNNATGTVTQFDATNRVATVDLTALYAPYGVVGAQREFTLGTLGDLTIQDILSFDESLTRKNLDWTMHTYANISLSQSTSSATLTQQGRTLSLVYTSNELCSLSTVDVNLQPPEYSTAGVRKILISCSITPGHTITLTVHLTWQHS